MHRHDNALHSVHDLPICARPGETYIFPQGSSLDVERAVSEILSAPNLFALVEIELSALGDQIKGRDKLNFHYVATMERDRARRPLLLGTSDHGDILLLDGRHRAARSLQLGYKTTKAWVLTLDQMALFRSAPLAPPTEF
jgi:hypothetical protein